jgi:hypothetical protein
MQHLSHALQADAAESLAISSTLMRVGFYVIPKELAYVVNGHLKFVKGSGIEFRQGKILHFGKTGPEVLFEPLEVLCGLVNLLCKLCHRNKGD